ncbi:Holliday junction resolvase [Vulcanisaeta sp. EB80]|jgi:Holliday junction resolvase - archaeal type|uniref:Holliday junction resolvase Hjc n=1 Tax=Vulcanisaeta sp. EB80 TaxID=1650660 RepID=UPI000746A95D|nr:Holliday junction resolvase Hjc [Vulcanisaeta sp. EB80]KUO80389.1 MAG: Holliday junction resolvase [Vulcanisaeta sp. OSP_8]KUO81025.1 MAG: Holliday junction resolvase [Vulcanisaeta sp. JCHS_4]KUO89443.1 MAG: Holliday junction resolvase [Vulcanisaeta sp. MG_3]KUO92736.1 MAG: Holliday junction resolvase [Vulcanisaeta sp. CIS_19]MCG2864245.1 Holliday junction resolvase [Vulcanisaeta sp.]PVU72137.1 Holliday junction resolvase [Vulcanisaeta sp. SCGC AB-777_J10]
MSIPKRKGSAHERNLANKLWDMGLAVLRGCSSGGGVRKRFVPDIVAMGPGFVLVLEVKYRSERNPIRIEEEKVSKLLEFAERARGHAYIAVKFKGDDWRFIPVTSKSSIVIKPDDLNNAYTLEQLISKYVNRSLLDFLK